MSGSPGGRHLVWIPVVIALGALTLTGCKKTSHATKPIANISQAATATAPASASSSPTVASPTSASASVTAPPVAASLSATSVPVPTPTPTAKTGTGCSLIPLTAVASALGVASVTTQVHPTTLHPPIVAHQGCQYLAGAAGAGWDVNTFDTTAAPPQAFLAAQMAKVPGAKPTTIDGVSGYAIVLPGGTGEEEVALYKGHQDIVILTHGKTGASVALAQLIAAAI